jgi:hypothetical protein
MGRTRSTHGELRNLFIILVGKTERKKFLGNLGGHAQLLLQGVLRRLWNRFIRLRTGIKGRPL